MKKLLIKLGLLMALPLTALQTSAAVPAYDMEAAKANAQADFANWMKYLPDDVFVAHVSIPGTHDTATGFGFKSTLGATTSQTQDKQIGDQLNGGVRAFDFRPGVNGNDFSTLWCTHGTMVTNYKMDDAFNILIEYLEAHPTEFFVIHLFRGNVGDGDGNKNSAQNREDYNKLIDSFFNNGKYAQYIKDYDPFLKVRDVRKKIIVLRRDRIDFAHISKAGNLWNWPGSEDLWTENSSKTNITKDIDTDVKGYVRVTDVSDPSNKDIMTTKQNSVTNLYNWCINQPLPNDKKRIDGYYNPDWAITFTSAEYKTGTNAAGGRGAYCAGAEIMNPHFTNLIKDPTKKKGPCGIVFSDWVLVDTYKHTVLLSSKTYNVKGVEIVSAIAYNNFDYIADYILDDELFAEPTEADNIWDESKEYFLKNVGTGDFLAGGQWYGTHATTGAHGLKVTPKMNNGGDYYLRTPSSNNGLGKYGTFGVDSYIDNFFFPQYFDVKSVGGNKYVFITQGGDVPKAIGANSDIWDQFKRDGTTHTVDQYTKNENDPYQQWEVIPVEDYYQEQIAKASMDNGSDISFAITGGRFFGNDFENNEGWSFTSGGKAYKENTGIGPNDSQRTLYVRTDAGTSSNWTLRKEVKNLPEGVYTLRWKAYRSDIDNVKMTVNSRDVSSQLKKGAQTAESINRENVGAEMVSDEFTCAIEKFEINDGELIINATAPANEKVSVFILDDFELIYYGIDYEKAYPILFRTIKDAKRRLGITEDSDMPEWLQTYENTMKAMGYDKEDGGAAPAKEIYLELRKLTLNQDHEDNAHPNFTNVLINPGFETGTMMGWTTTFEGLDGADTGVRPTTSDKYAMENSYNSYLFHTSQSGRGVILSQTIPGPAADPAGLPAGKYKISAQAADDADGYMYIDVNGQKSEPIPVKSPAGISELIEFEFSVAEKTDSITISFMGGNADQSYDDFGGTWYQIDNVRLERVGDKEMCPFFLRLKEAIKRANEIAAITFADAPEFLENWKANLFMKKIDDLIKDHENNGGTHKNDDTLEGSNGLAEMTELFSELAALATSQTKTGSNMSAAIRNNSFELGTLDYWERKAAPEADALVTTGGGTHEIVANSEDPTVKKDLEYFYYTKHDDGESVHAYPIYQTISGLPVGYYKLTAFVASNAGNQLVLAANDQSSLWTVKKDNEFEKVEVMFTITEEQYKKGGELKLGLYPIASGESFLGQENQADVMGPWYAVDNFDLRLVGRDITVLWEMETDTHGTIILPFDVEQGVLADYGLTVHSVFEEIGDPNVVDAEYRLIKTQQEEMIHANTPYLVIRKEANKPVAQNKSIRAVTIPEDGKYEFSGKTSNDAYNYSPEGNLLIGTLVQIDAAADQHHLSQDNEGNIEFKLHEKNVDHTTVEPYHAYIKFEAATPESNVKDLYLEDPTHSMTWTREGDYYGTIMLPFEHEIPEGMKVYTIDGVTTETETPKQMPNDETATYQVLHLEEITTGYFAANTPYLVIMDSVNESTEEPENEPETQAYQLKAATRDAATPAPKRYTFTGQAIYDQKAYTNEFLTGVHEDSQATGYVLNESGKTAQFNSATTSVGANHAYIGSDKANPTYLLLVEPQSEEDPGLETGIEEILIADKPVDIYSLQGVRVAHDVLPAEGLRNLAPGIYILRSAKGTVKVIK